MASLTPGTRLGPYEITGAIGAGGMGEVYRASDTRLNRQVAIKCVNSEWTADPSSRQRIEREARAIASLSHPNICTLFDVGQHNGELFLVMELMEGETLASRLARAKQGLPLAEALGIGTSIAEALAAAHRHGLVHRDIKPGNIMLTASGTKLLDFGLAKPSNNAADETRGLLTQPNERLGTPAYMAPEQMTGTADHRSDIYSFGIVLFEMLTGSRAVTSDGPSAILRSKAPPALDRVVRKCLEPDPERRWQSAADLADELSWIASMPIYATTAPQRWRTTTAVVAIGAVLLSVALIAWQRFTGLGTALAVQQLSFLVPPNVSLLPAGAGVALSPDASMVAFAGSAGPGAGSPRHLFVKRLDAPEARMIANSEDAIYPMFSPDGQAVAFFGAGLVRRWSVTTDEVTTVAKGDYGSEGSWGADDVLRFGLHGDQPALGIRSLPASGGEATVVTRPDNAQGEVTHFGPQQLPAGLLFSIRSVGSQGTEFKVVVRADSGMVTTLIPGASLARYLGDGQLVYQVDNTLMLADFDPVGLRLSNARTIIDGVFISAGGAAWSIAGDTLVYRPAEPPRRRLAWIDRTGRSTPVDTEPRNFQNPRISQAGDRVVVTVQGLAASVDLWLLDLSRGTLAPLTTDGVSSGGAAWSADDKLIFANRSNGAARDVIQLSTDGSAASRVLLSNGGQNFVAAVDPRSQLMAVMTPGPGGRDLAVMHPDDPATLRGIVQTPANEFGGRLSPDGRWLSYFSDASGRFELYVTPFPNGGPKWQVSRNGAREAVWSHSGRELYFRRSDSMYVVAVHDSPNFSWDPPRELFTGAFFQQGGPGNMQYDVAADGRFLMIEEVPVRSASFNVVRGWRQLAQ
jgi:serine/threonine-protein kinase